jgi:hypothetical protein
MDPVGFKRLLLLRHYPGLRNPRPHIKTPPPGSEPFPGDSVIVDRLSVVEYRVA